MFTVKTFFLALSMPPTPLLFHSEIGVCGRVGRYFPARLPSEGRSEGGASVGVLFGRNGGRRKISPVKVVGGKVFRRWFGFCKAL